MRAAKMPVTFAQTRTGPRARAQSRAALVVPALSLVVPVLSLILPALVSAGCSTKLLGVSGSIVVAPAALDFGQTTIGTPQSITVQVSNQGSAALQISNILVASDPYSELSLSGQLMSDCSGVARSGSPSLSPGDCAQFNVIWTPTSVHAAQGDIQIQSTDPIHPKVDLNVTGSSIIAVGCNPPCGTGTACCNDVCVDIESSPTHCGSCLACTQGDSCNSGTCVSPIALGCSPSCTTGESCCNDACINTQSDPAHCGGCGACPSGDTCQSGVCTPPAQTTSCDPVSAPCANNELCCNHVCEAGTSAGGTCPCTGGPLSDFGVGSIIIPMDVCWQRGEDETSTPSYCTDNAKTTSDDAPLKAYGLVFFLIRHQVTVYVAIDPNKASIDAPDMALVSLDPTPPVLRYNWSTGQAVPLGDTTQTTVQYRGGPFLIDASQHDRVMQLLASDPDFQQFRTEGNITLHIATEGFQSTVAKSIDAVPSRIALLTPANDGSNGMGSTYQILVRYLESAGLNFSGAGGTPSAPGQIYDQLQESDFLPDYNGSNLKLNGYKLLWAPHWEGGTSNTSAQLATIGDYVNAGGDLFAECAAIGTLEGFTQGSRGSGHGGGGANAGSAATRFMTNNGFAGNILSIGGGVGGGGTYTGPFTFGGLSSVFAQRGDFPFAGFTGAISDYYPNTSASSTYYPGVTRLVSATSGGTQTDLFTMYDQHAAGKGTVVYLAGHDYSYGGQYASDQGTTAGSRLVLNTLFSLGTNDVCTP